MATRPQPTPGNTSVDLFHDAIIRRQVYLGRYSNTLNKRIGALLDKTEQDVRHQLELRLAKMVQQGVDFGPDTTSRLKVLEASLRELRGVAWREVEEVWTTELQGLAKAEAKFLDSAFKENLGVVVETALPPLSRLASILGSNPFEGKVLKDWAATLAKGDIERMMAQIRIGLTQGETMDAITRRLLGSGPFDGLDGVLSIARKHAESVTRTAVQHISNEARSMYFEANEDLIEEEMFVATLDGRTTAICRANDGTIHPVGEGPQPPLHWNCRSLRVAVFNQTLIGDRPAKAWLEKDMEGLTKDEQRELKRRLTGRVPANTTYQQFLERQTADFQKEVLGVTKAELFRNGGLKLDKFVDMNSGREFTLEQLAKAEPAAFRRAGLDPKDFR
jgi:SPP1 gp7 family putative phage head morphogenesis protein